MLIELFDLRGQYSELREDINTAVTESLCSGTYILGPRVRELEKTIANYCGTSYGVGVASGSDALFLSLLACGIGDGDEVITSPFTFFATAGAITRTGATPVFVDIEPGTCNINPEKIKSRITAKTRAIVPVHVFGQMADMDAVLSLADINGLVVIEDACQAMGAEYRGRRAGSLGHAGCFSFFPTKNLGGYGDGGMVVTQDDRLAARVETLRAHGSPSKFVHESIGYNSRLDELQAAVLLVKFKHLERWIEQRNALARHYDQLLGDIVAIPLAMEGNRHTYHLYVIRSLCRDIIKTHLERNGIGCGIYYPIPLHLQKAYKHLGYKAGDLPEAERAAAEVLAIPLHPGLSSAEIEKIVQLVRDVAAQESGVRGQESE
ncbi:MAG: DegT/DnrJ/EryC1/StrS family aminotransferase [Desulfotomaculaceae bacterium]